MTVGSKSRNMLGSEITQSTVVLALLAYLNCEIENMIWLHSVLLLNYYITNVIINMPLFFMKSYKIARFSNIILQFDHSNVSKKQDLCRKYVQ